MIGLFCAACGSAAGSNWSRCQACGRSDVVRDRQLGGYHVKLAPGKWRFVSDVELNSMGLKCSRPAPSAGSSSTRRRWGATRAPTATAKASTIPTWPILLPAIPLALLTWWLVTTRHFYLAVPAGWLAIGLVTLHAWSLARRRNWIHLAPRLPPSTCPLPPTALDLGPLSDARRPAA